MNPPDPNDRPPAATGDVLEFLTKDYEIKANFLIKHYERMWTRFSAFSVFETGLFAAIAFSIQYRIDVVAIRWLFGVGLAVSLLWACVGMEDRKHVVQYRRHIRQALDKIKHDDKFRKILSDYSYVGQPVKDSKDDDVAPGITSLFSITRSPARVAQGLCILWLLMMVLSFLAPTYFQLPAAPGSSC